MQLPEYIPFDMTCLKCEYEPVCFIPLKVCHKLTRTWFRYLREQGVIKRASLCRQGRKRKVIKQCTIAEAIDRLHRHQAEVKENEETLTCRQEMPA